MQTDFQLTVKRARWLDPNKQLESDYGVSMIMCNNRTGRLSWWRFMSDDGTIWELDFGPNGQGPERWKAHSIDGTWPESAYREGDPDDDSPNGCFVVK